MLYEHLHHIIAGITGAAAVVVLNPFMDMLSKIVVGTSVGLLTWVLTKLFSYLLKRLNEHIRKAS